MAKFDCIDKRLSKLFYSYGKFVSKWPLIFLLIPLVVAAALSVGIMFLKVDDDVIFLFTPDTSEARDDSEIVYDLFPIDYNEYSVGRGRGTEDLMTNIIVRPVTGDNVLEEDVISEILRLDREIRNMTVLNEHGMEYSYDSLCAMSADSCLVNPVLEAFDYNASRASSVSLMYPFFDVTATERLFVGSTLGDVSLEDNSTVVTAGFFALSYPLQTTSSLTDLGIEWEKQFKVVADAFDSDKISIAYITSQSLDNEIAASTEEIIPLFSISYTFLITFAICSCIVLDWVFTKAELGFMGVISASLAVASTLGLLSYAGVNFNVVASSMPFLIVGIGIDDMFIMIAAWRKTKPSESVEERMGMAYSEAAVSITITSITDALAFGIGSIAPLPAVRVFCLYTGIAVIFDYIYQITFFGACMVYSGRREGSNRHVWTCLKVKSRNESPSIPYSIFCSGGLSEEERRQGTRSSCDAAIMTFFKDYYGPALMNPIVKFVALLTYCAYVAGAVYGIMNISEGLELKLLARTGSTAQEFYEEQSDYLSVYGPSVSVVIQDSVSYNDPMVQRILEGFVEDFESSQYIHSSEYTQFWLRDYLEYLDAASIPNKTDPDTFISVLVDAFLTNSVFAKYDQDILFTEGSNKTEIEASRFLLMGDSLVSTNEQVALMRDVRNRASQSNITMTAFSPLFIVYEQYASIRPLTIQNLSIAVASMFVVAFLLIPNPICSIFVTACIVSIEAGIIGYMSLWDVRLDSISMINLILCIGFSVDFSAHITYSFLSGEDEYQGRFAHSLSKASQRAVMALYSLGMPILQGAVSTMIAVIVLRWASAYIFVAFFKIMLLVMLFGVLHSLVFLPVLFSSVGFGFSSKAPATSPQNRGIPMGDQEMDMSSTKGAYENSAIAAC